MLLLFLHCLPLIVALVTRPASESFRPASESFRMTGQAPRSFAYADCLRLCCADAYLHYEDDW